jgi:hypothetical protein
MGVVAGWGKTDTTFGLYNIPSLPASVLILTPHYVTNS